ncbi:MAG: hypothetical protein Q9185_003198 [Variospora sp. 1 TL-2023]
MDEFDLEKGGHIKPRSQCPNQSSLEEPSDLDSHLVRTLAEADVLGSSHINESDGTSHIVKSTNTQIKRFLRALLRTLEDEDPLHAAHNDHEQSEKAAVAGSNEPISGSQARSENKGPSGGLEVVSPSTVGLSNPTVMSSSLKVDGNAQSPSRPCCGRWSACAHGPEIQVEVLSDSTIFDTDQGRKAVRKKWQIDRSMEQFLDPWKSLWYPQQGSRAGLCAWECDDTRRQQLQLSLVDALATGRPEPFFDEIMCRDSRAITCWLSLIGIRLNDIYESSEDDNYVVRHPYLNTISPMDQIEVLIECIWTCNACSNAEVGKVLEKCYRRKILTQPSFQGISDLKRPRQILGNHVCAVRVALYLVGLLFKHDLPIPHPHEDPDKVWTMPVNEVEEHMRQSVRAYNLDGRTDYFFRIDDLTLKDLQGIGCLHIHWTSHWDEHLKLETGDDENKLYIYWFHPGLFRYFPATGLCGRIENSELVDRSQEIVRTLAFLFSSGDGAAVSRQSYERLGAPSWLHLLVAAAESQHPQKSPPSLSQFNLDFADGSTVYCRETEFHISLCCSGGAEDFPRKRSYSGFPYYENRLRELRAYMDSQQPKGLRGLWQDKRNSYYYYTFWLVILFSALTLFVGVGSLAAAIAQVWGQFQSLHASRKKR